MNGFPAAVERYIERVLRERASPLMLTFDLNWALLEAHGDAARFGIDTAAGSSDVELLRDLFLGLPAGEAQDFPFVSLPGGGSAHVHGVPDGQQFHVLLLDASEEFARLRSQQQLGHEAELVSQEKSKALARLRQIRGELENQRSRLEEANALKNALIATLSHEFRTPLTSIFGYVHLLERRISADVSGLQALRALRRNATYLFALAENLLEYGRGESGATLLNPSAVDLPALAADLEAMFRPLAEDKGLAFALELDLAAVPNALFDEIKLRQILINLLSNALRYTLRGEVRARLAWENARLVIEVRDTGIGIPADYRERIFTPFNRGAQHGSKGAGLGLSIVKRLVEQMHGEISLHSELGVGSTFRIALPGLGPVAASPITRAFADIPGGAERWIKGGRAVVLDDDPDVSGLLALLLTDLGFEVEVVADVPHAVERVRADPPQVLLVDVELPGLSGNAAVYQLRSQGYGGRIVTLSATATEDARNAALAAGADYYMTKPINLEQLVRVLQRATVS
jgi:signal transduction histidine kinase/CheY-like chemotaxis protein